MTKYLLLTIMIVVVLASATWATDSNKRYGIVYSTGEIGDGRYATIEEARQAIASELGLSRLSSTTGTIDTVFKNWSTDLAPYFGGGPGDTMTVLFDPGACIVKQIICNIGYNGGNPGTNLIDGMNVSLHWANYDGYCEIAGNKTLMGTMELNGQWTPESWYAEKYSKPPVGEVIWGPFPLGITADPAEALEFVETIWMGSEPDNTGKPFVVAFVPYGAAGTNCGFADRQQEGVLENADRMWKWYTTDHKWYNWRQIGFRMYLIVEFYANIAPVISDLTQIAGTYNANKEFIAEATLTDQDYSDATKAGISSAYLIWSSTSGKVDSVVITKADGNVWRGQIKGVAVPDTIKYWVSAKDKGVPSLYSRCSSKTFVLAKPQHPNADLLLVLQGPHNAQFYRDALSKRGYVYEEWDADGNNGIDASITGYGWKTIVLAGWVVNTIPTRGYTDNPYAAFLKNGGNLLLGSMDYFYANNEPGAVDTTFAAGDFAYDFFGLAGGMSDPAQNIDSVITGVAGDPISGDWATTPLTLSWYAYANLRTYNWIDYITVGNGTKIFTAQSGRDVGIRMQGSNFKTVFISFMADAVGDSVASAGFDKLIQNVLTWFGTSKVVSVETPDKGDVVNAYSLKQNYPNPFNPETIIEYNIPEEGLVKITVYNVLGEKVAELVNKDHKAGKYTVTWNAKEATTGVYFYKLEAGNYTKRMKMLLIR